MSSAEVQTEKVVNTDAAKYFQSAESSDDKFLGPHEHKLQRQLKNRHIAMIRSAEPSHFYVVKSLQLINNVVLVVSLELVRLRHFIR
jgi:hypothetical protein